MDNKIFNVNGRTIEQLELAVQLVLLDEYGQHDVVSGYYVSPKKGMVITRDVTVGKSKPFTDSLGNPKIIIGYKELASILFDWLMSPEAKTIECIGGDENYPHDGSNDLGWRIYVEEWGHIRGDDNCLDHSSIFAFKPAYLWYGK